MHKSNFQTSLANSKKNLKRMNNKNKKLIIFKNSMNKN